VLFLQPVICSREKKKGRKRKKGGRKKDKSKGGEGKDTAVHSDPTPRNLVGWWLIL